MPVLIDRDHLLTELYAVSNVPTVMWIDEHDRIVRPNANEFGTDTFAEYTGIHSEEHLELVRRWVHRGEVPIEPDDATEAVADLSADEIAARLHFRLATHLRRNDDEAGSERHFERAVALTPLDFTISRAAMPLRGQNPFGEEFFALMKEWQDAGSPYHGMSRRNLG